MLRIGGEDCTKYQKYHRLRQEKVIPIRKPEWATINALFYVFCTFCYLLTIFPTSRAASALSQFAIVLSNDSCAFRVGCSRGQLGNVSVCLPCGLWRRTLWSPCWQSASKMKEIRCLGITVHRLPMLKHILLALLKLS